MLDSGACYNCITPKILDRLRGANIAFEITSSSRRDPGAANGQRMHIQGEVKLNLKLGENPSERKKSRSPLRDKNVTNDWDEVQLVNCDFVIFKELNHEVILGCKTLRALQFTLGKNEISIGPAKTICQVVPSTQGVELLRLQSETATVSNKWGLYFLDRCEETGDSIRNREAKEALSRPKLGEMQPVVLVAFAKGEDVPESIVREKETSAPGIRNIEDQKKCEQNEEESTKLNNILSGLAENSDFTPAGKSELKTLLENFRTIFSTTATDVGEYKDEQATLELKPGYEDKIYVPSRRIPHQLRPWLRKHLQEMIESDILERSEGSPYNSPIFLVEKPNKKGYRVVNDFRLLNQGLKHNRYPIPHIKDYLDQLHGSQFFSSIDLRSGFYNVVLSEESRPLTAFNACGDTLRFKRLAQGVKTSPAIFQAVMAKVTGDLLNKRAVVYLDDLLAFDKTENDALETIRLVLERFMDKGFKLNPEKCNFGKKEIDFLGYSITATGWRPTKDKITAVLTVEKPETVKALRRFNGMVNYFYLSVPNLQVRMSPLYKLTSLPKGAKSKDKVIEWNDTADAAFEEVKTLLAETARNAFYSSDIRDRLYLSTDSSLTGYGAVLSQYQHNLGQEVPLGYCSGAYSGSQLNWPIVELELFALVEGLRNFDTYLFARNFCWRTDSKCLSYLHSEGTVKSDASKLKPKIARWVEFIEQFSFDIEHHMGESEQMTLPDVLSRSFQKQPKLDSIVIKPSDNGNVGYKLQAELWFKMWKNSGLRLYELIEAQEKDQELSQFTGPYSVLKSKTYLLFKRDGIQCVRFRERDLVVLPSSLVVHVLRYIHLPQHYGQMTMLKLMKSKFWTPALKRNVRQFAISCQDCIRVKAQASLPNKPIMQTSSPHPWMSVHADLIGPFPPSYNQNCYVLVCIDNLTRFVDVEALRDKTAESVMAGFMKIVTRRGSPASLLCDNGREFHNCGLRELMFRMGTNLQHSTPLQPQTNGVVERVNQKIKRCLKLWDANSVNWEDHIHLAAFLINKEYHSALQTSPWCAFHGWDHASADVVNPAEIIEEFSGSIQCSEYAKGHIQRMQKALANLYESDYTAKADRFYKLQSAQDSRNLSDNQFSPKDRVLVKMKQLKGSCGKLTNEWRGIYRILRQVDANVYFVYLEGNQRRRFLVHKRRLRKLPDEKNMFNDNECSVLEDSKVIAEKPEPKNSKEFQGETKIPENNESGGRLRSGRRYQ